MTPHLPRHPVVRAVVLAALLSLAGGCGSSGPARSSGTSAAAGAPTTTAKRSVVDRTLPRAACPAPVTPPRQPTTTAAPAPGQWPPPGYDKTALVRADVLSWKGGTAVVRWDPARGTGACTATLAAPVAWVLDANGYRRIEGDAIGAFIAQRRAELGSTAEAVPFLVEVSPDGTTALQFGEVPPG